ncbi:hypothetical protein UlMin_001166 [Ulmus minor]
MKAVLIRTGSVSLPVQWPTVSGSPGVCLSRTESFSSVFSGEKTSGSSKVSLHFEVNRRRNSGIRRAFSESDVIRSESETPGGSRCRRPARIPEEDDGVESSILNRTVSLAGDWPVSGIPLEELGFSDGGFGKGSKSGGGGDYGFGTSNGGFNDRSKLGVYYQEMLKSNPGDSLLLRNYAKFLYEVEKDSVRAEEYYSRAILACPGDGELLSQYGKLVWETQRDEDRAKSYFDQAITASPEDSTVLGSYAHFMWEAEEDDEEEVNNQTKVSFPDLVPAF